MGRMIGKLGMRIDNIVSLSFVDTTGTLQTGDAKSSPDLWWALRGSATNFSIVTSVTMRAHPVLT